MRRATWVGSALAAGIILVSGGCAADRVVAADVGDPGASRAGLARPLFVVDGVRVDGADIDPGRIADVQVLKGDVAVARFGEAGRAGVVVIRTQGAAPQR